MADIPVCSYEDLRKKADEFLHEHHPSGNIPVPIEEIVEFDFGINIVPVLGLQREFEVEGFISGDLKSIYVDEYIYTDRITRYRFTLAHEIGHVVLHRHLYASHKFKSIPRWKEFINSLTEEEHSWLEYQGYAFAGLVLVPKQHLVKYTNEWTKKIKDKGISK
ncbi:MAG: ImmA/IrrE family metallo-endopeptidase [Nitrospira sp.]|nr:ImmA/IrrE family metallo-endopeptidase [Nitrospira sp.]